MSGNAASDRSTVVGRDIVCETVAAILRGAQAKGWTDERLSGVTGIPARSLKSYRVEGVEPTLSVALSLAVALGAEAMNTLVGLAGYAAKPVGEADEQSPGLIVAGMIGELQTIAQASADNRIDHQEAPAVEKAATNLISLASHFRKSA